MVNQEYPSSEVKILSLDVITKNRLFPKIILFKLLVNPESIDDQIILKHLEKLSEGKLKLHKDFKIIEDSKATSKKTSNSKKSNHRNNKRKRY